MKTSRNLAKKRSPYLRDLRCFSKTQRGPVLLLTLMAETRHWRRKLASLDHLGFPMSLASRNRHRASDAKAGVEGEEMGGIGFLAQVP